MELNYEQSSYIVIISALMNRYRLHGSIPAVRLVFISALCLKLPEYKEELRSKLVDDLERDFTGKVTKKYVVLLGSFCSYS